MRTSRSETDTTPLDEQIERRRADIRVDKLDMTYSEFANMYERGELVVSPAYQRLFRWTGSQKAKFIESILLGIPTPAIFVAETEIGVWELVDGLQRISTVFEFFGVLKDADGAGVEPSRLCPESGMTLSALNGLRFSDMTMRARLSIRRAGCRVEVIKVGSSSRMKYDLFERLNTGGTQLTDQEIRNCIFRDQANELMEFFDRLALFEPFQQYLSISDNQAAALYDRGLVLRFFALKNNLAEFRHDVEPFVTDYVHKVADQKVVFDRHAESEIFTKTMKVIADALGENAWRHTAVGGTRRNAFSVYVFEALSIAVARHIDMFAALPLAQQQQRLEGVKSDEEFRAATGSGKNTRVFLNQRIEVAERVIQRPVA